MVGDVSTDQNIVRITGPESVISQVAKASVDVDVTGFTSDINTNMEIRLYDAEGHIVSDKNLTQNIKNVQHLLTIPSSKHLPVANIFIIIRPYHNHAVFARYFPFTSLSQSVGRAVLPDIEAASHI